MIKGQSTDNKIRYHILTIDEMVLRAFYFKELGIFREITDSADLIQICRETREVIVSKDNVYYQYFPLDKETYQLFMTGMDLEP